jgi:hypothetical protein
MLKKGDFLMLNEEQLAKLSKMFEEEILPVIIANEDKFNEFTKISNEYFKYKEEFENEEVKETHSSNEQTSDENLQDDAEPDEYTPIRSYHIDNFKHMYFSLREDKEITKTHIENVMDELSSVYDEVTGIDLSLEEAEDIED